MTAWEKRLSLLLAVDHYQPVAVEPPADLPQLGRRVVPGRGVSTGTGRRPWPWGHYRMSLFDTARLVISAVAGLGILVAGVAMLEPAPIVLGALLVSGSTGLILVARWLSRKEP